MAMRVGARVIPFGSSFERFKRDAARSLGLDPIELAIINPATQAAISIAPDDDKWQDKVAVATFVPLSQYFTPGQPSVMDPDGDCTRSYDVGWRPPVLAEIARAMGVCLPTSPLSPLSPLSCCDPSAASTTLTAAKAKQEAAVERVDREEVKTACSYLRATHDAAIRATQRQEKVDMDAFVGNPLGCRQLVKSDSPYEYEVQRDQLRDWGRRFNIPLPATGSNEAMCQVLIDHVTQLRRAREALLHSSDGTYDYGGETILDRVRVVQVKDEDEDDLYANVAGQRIKIEFTAMGTRGHTWFIPSHETRERIKAVAQEAKHRLALDGAVADARHRLATLGFNYGFSANPRYVPARPTDNKPHEWIAYAGRAATPTPVPFHLVETSDWKGQVVVEPNGEAHKQVRDIMSEQESQDYRDEQERKDRECECGAEIRPSQSVAQWARHGELDRALTTHLKRRPLEGILASTGRALLTPLGAGMATEANIRAVDRAISNETNIRAAKTSFPTRWRDDGIAPLDRVHDLTSFVAAYNLDGSSASSGRTMGVFKSLGVSSLEDLLEHEEDYSAAIRALAPPLAIVKFRLVPAIKYESLFRRLWPDRLRICGPAPSLPLSTSSSVSASRASLSSSSSASASVASSAESPPV